MRRDKIGEVGKDQTLGALKVTLKILGSTLQVPSTSSELGSLPFHGAYLLTREVG